MGSEMCIRDSPKTGNVTATASGIEAAKSHSAVGTWANALKDALEQAFALTAKWKKSAEKVSVSINTDFAVGQWGVDEIKELREARASGDLSLGTYWDELSRRGVLGPQFDPKTELDALLGEIPGDDDDDIHDARPPPPNGAPQSNPSPA
mgnify:CR=1 FL=1